MRFHHFGMFGVMEFLIVFGLAVALFTILGDAFRPAKSKGKGERLEDLEERVAKLEKR